MTLNEFIEILKAIEEDKPFSVGFQLQHSSEDGLTLQKLVDFIHPSSIREFMERIQRAELPTYDE